MPREALTERDSAPPKILRRRMLVYASPSPLPALVPVLRRMRDFSRTVR